MIFIWGSRGREETCGHVGDVCPSCRQPRQFAVVSYFKVSHIYYIPLGGGSLVATVQKCAGCGNQYHYTAERFASMLDARGGPCSMPELMQRTNPEMWEKIKQFYPENDPANLPPPYFGHVAPSRFIAPLPTGPGSSDHSTARMLLPIARKRDPFLLNGARNLGLEADVQAAAKWLKAWAWVLAANAGLTLATSQYGKQNPALGNRADDMVFFGLYTLIMILVAFACHRLADGLAQRNPESCKNAFYLYIFGLLFTVCPLLIAVISGHADAAQLVSLTLSSSVAVLTFWALGMAACSVCTPAYEEALRQPGEVPPIVTRPLFLVNAACMTAFVFAIIWKIASG